MGANITSIQDWKFQRSKLSTFLSKKVEQALSVPNYMRDQCSLFMDNESGHSVKVLSFRIRPNDIDLMRALWVLFNDPTGSSIGKEIIRLFKMHGIHRNSVKDGDFLFLHSRSISYAFTANGFKPKAPLPPAHEHRTLRKTGKGSR